MLRMPSLGVLPPRPGPVPKERGFTLIELLFASLIVLGASITGVMLVMGKATHVSWSKEIAFARQRAVSILGELKSYVEGGNLAADLDDFDDGGTPNPVLTITEERGSPGTLVTADNAISGNQRHQGDWMWYRTIDVRPFGAVASRDRRIVTVRVFKVPLGGQPPGDQMAEVSSVIRTGDKAYPTTQVFDLYLLALENVPGWWVNMDAIQPFVEAALTDLEGRNPGLRFNVHWITKLGFGRDDEYAPYTNETRVSTDPTPWTYVYPGALPSGEAVGRYYVASRFGARVNLDGQTAPVFANDLRDPEPYVDANGNGRYDEGEKFTDTNDDEEWDPGNRVPYALADMHNHAMRWPEEKARFDARVAAGLDDEQTPTWRMLLDQMVSDPTRFHNAILVNLHGELLPMPPVRNFSDAAKDPELRRGWRVVAHPELLRSARVAGSDTTSNPVRFRVYAYKTEMTGTEVVTTQAEPWVDLDRNGVWNAGETFTDWNGNGAYDAGLPISLVLPDGNFAQAPNAATNPSIRVRRLRGGVDADGSGAADPYQAWDDAPRLPEVFTDANGDGIRQRAEPWVDLNGNGAWDDFEPYIELDGDGAFTAADEALQDANGNGVLDLARPAETFTDANGNGRWDSGEPFWDADGNGIRTAPTLPKLPLLPWNPLDWGATGKINNYLKFYGEPFQDLDGDAKYDAPEAFVDSNGNGVWDGGFRRGEMWFEIAYESSPARTVLRLHGTPLETPYESSTQRGLPTASRLYDLDYVPCPTPATATDTNRFTRDLYTAGSSVPKNTARWIVELSPAAIRRGYESASGANDGDASDRIVTLETRLGADLSTGTMWPTRHKPANVSRTYAYYHASVATIPFSERHQFLGDPRHCPYADLDRRGPTTPHGYNWYFDDFSDSSTNAQASWLAFDPSRLDDGWLARASGHDLPRLLSWLRTALTKSEVVYTTLTGWSYFYMSVGGDVGSDTANGFPNSIPMDGTPFGLTGAVNENSIIDGNGTSSIRGSLKYVRSNTGSLTSGIRAGGAWWSKPWLGELAPDATYTTQWAQWGNLRAATGTTADTYRLIRRGDVPAAQQPRGTTLVNLYARLSSEGCTSVFNVGTSSSTFHHQGADGKTGSLVEDGSELAANYGYGIPSTTPISRPFGLATSGSGGVGPEFSFTDTYPRYSAAFVRKFYNHQTGQTGSALVRLREPGTNPSGGYVVVNGLDKTLGTGSAFIARYSVLTLVHGFLAAGLPGAQNRIKQIPRVEILGPSLDTEITNPASVQVRWKTSWTRWDGRRYTGLYPATFSEGETDLRYVLLYSGDGGKNWKNVKDDSVAEPGTLPWAGGGADAARVLTDQTVGGDEVFTWATPVEKVPQGAYMLRLEVYRASERLHHAFHQEKFYVDR